ncbi:MAG: GNAT family N-acetyltransferase [Verrucomicrobiota bacterium]
MVIEYREGVVPEKVQLVELYQSMDWSSARVPDDLYRAMVGSHWVVTAWEGDRLVGLGNAISDGALVVYFPHLIVHPDLQGGGIGWKIVERLKARYEGFHQQCLISDSKTAGFYEKCGFERVDRCPAMWIYQGEDH